MKSLTVWIIQTGEPLHIDNGNSRPMRAINLANILVKKGHKVVLWSSAFNYSKKEHKSRQTEVVQIDEKLEIRLIPSHGYQRNISLKRFWDHAILALNLKALVRTRS